jgi:hypothetical protein
VAEAAGANILWVLGTRVRHQPWCDDGVRCGGGCRGNATKRLATLQRAAGEAARLLATVALVVLPAWLLTVLLARLRVRLLTSVSLAPLAWLLVACITVLPAVLLAVASMVRYTGVAASEAAGEDADELPTPRAVCQP